MNLKEAEDCIKEVFNYSDTKGVFCREDFISGSKKVLRPLAVGENHQNHKGRLIVGENLVIMGSGKTWEEAVRQAITPELMRRQEAARLRAANAEYAGERFAVFLREKFDAEYNAWITTSPTAALMQKEFERRMGVTTEEVVKA